MVTNENAIRVTSDQARALRKADVVVFHFHNDQHFIRAIKEYKDEFGKGEREVRVDVQGRVETYGRQRLGEVEECSTVMSFAQDSKHLQTAFSSLRKDDIIYLVWRSANNNQYLDRANLYRDELYLQVHRGEFNRNVKEYFITSSVTPNNSAKMVKHESTEYRRF